MEDSLLHFTTNSTQINRFDSTPSMKTTNFENSVKRNLFTDSISQPIRSERCDRRMFSDISNNSELCKSSTRSTSNPVRDCSGIATSASSSGHKFTIHFKKNDIIPKPEYNFENTIDKNLEGNNANVNYKSLKSD